MSVLQDDMNDNLKVKYDLLMSQEVVKREEDLMGKSQVLLLF